MSYYDLFPGVMVAIVTSALCIAAFGFGVKKAATDCMTFGAFEYSGKVYICEAKK